MPDLTYEQLRGLVPCTIDGEQRKLRYDNRALKLMVDRLDLEGLGAIPSVLRNLDVDSLSIAVWAGMLHEQPSLELEDVRTAFYPFVPTMGAVVEAINLSFWGHPEGYQGPEDGEDPADPPAAASGSPGPGVDPSDSPPDGAGSTPTASGG